MVTRLTLCCHFNLKLAEVYTSYFSSVVVKALGYKLEG
jgi:hypothetical protein